MATRKENPSQKWRAPAIKALIPINPRRRGQSGRILGGLIGRNARFLPDGRLRFQ
jgi:hypothetical protein